MLINFSTSFTWSQFHVRVIKKEAVEAHSDEIVDVILSWRMLYLKLI